MTHAQATSETSQARNNRQTEVGTVVSDKGDKTIAVQVQYTRPHARYSKIIRCRTKLYAHDEKNEARVGDFVEIRECRRYSKMKSWRLVRIVRKGPRG
jgi:small subunit ribosomal protein S17